MDVSYYDQLLQYVEQDLYQVRARILLAGQIDKSSYSLADYFDDLYQGIFAATLAGRAPSSTEQYLETQFVLRATKGFQSARSVAPSMPSHAAFLTGLSLGQPQPAQQGEQWQLQGTAEVYRSSNPQANIYPEANITALDKSDLYFYSCLGKLRPLLEQRAAATQSPSLKAHYETLLFKVVKALDAKN